MAQQPVEISCRYPCIGVSSKPSRASAAAGAASSAHGTRPHRRCAASRPSAVPGTATAAAPVRKSCCVSPSKSTASSNSEPTGAARGTATKKSSTTVRPLSASCTSMNPPPPGPVSGLSHTHDTNAAATHASTAEPPASSTRAPACAVNGCPAAIAPFITLEATRLPIPRQPQVSLYVYRSRRPGT